MSANTTILQAKPLAASIAIHALLVGGLVAAGLSATRPDPAPVQAGSGPIWVTLLSDGAAGGDTAQPDAAAPPRAPEPAAPETAPRTARIARRAARPAPRPQPIAAATPEPAPSDEAPVAAPPGEPAVARIPVAGGGAPGGAPSAGGLSATARDAGARAATGSAGRAEPGSGWPGPDGVDRVARPRGPIRPVYPARARRAGEESTVVVEAWVDDGGEVTRTAIARSGGRDFDASARSAVERSAFDPARLAGRRVASRLALRIHFDLYD